MNREEIVWMSTQEAARRLGVTPRTLYRFVDEGTLAAYKMGRVFRLKEADVDAFIEGARVAPGSLEHLYPERRIARLNDANPASDGAFQPDEHRSDRA
ncbi:MAG: helix-turn-helix domain-containing protein [Acidimicrobiales bacterium]